MTVNLIKPVMTDPTDLVAYLSDNSTFTAFAEINVQDKFALNETSAEFDLYLKQNQKVGVELILPFPDAFIWYDY
jgi:hypothetical protein